MSKRFTLFTGQWADLTLEEVAGLAAGWGYDGLEIAVSGEHLDAWRWDEPGYVEGRLEILKKHGLGCWAISNHLTGQAICDDPIDERHQAIVREKVWGDGSPEGVRERAAEEMKLTARLAKAMGIDTVIGFTGSSIWQYVAMFPPVPAAKIDAGYADFAERWHPILDVFEECGVRFAHEVHPSEIAYDYWTTDAHARGDRAPAGVRDQLGPVAHGVAAARPGRVHHRLRRPDLPRRLQGHPDAGRRRPQRPALLAPALGRPAPRLGLRLRRPRRRAVGGLLPRARRDRATTGRSRSSGRTPAWTACTARPRHWSSCAGSTTSRRRRASTRRSAARLRRRGAPVSNRGVGPTGLHGRGVHRRERHPRRLAAHLRRRRASLPRPPRD